ncbi:MAG TPA: glycine--tRNA ligase subunit beta [Candidatus Pelagibacter sp.]|jgi:glycyl-tRNA synthetase beta chain|nr:glycine--tRNA ligase subunit beta [Candidatus Pelagibacter sp.]
MAELFIELFSEEIPAQLQIDARQKISQSIGEKLNKKEISFKSNNFFSTPNRLVIVIDGIPEKIEQNKKIIKGPKVDAPQIALQGFIKSNNLNKSDIYKKVIDKGEFYFASTRSKVINVLNELQTIIPESLQNYSWKKSMKWSTYELSWGRPLKSIVAVFNNTVINFNFFHLHSNNLTYINEIDSDKGKKVNDFKSYQNLLKNKNIILEQEKRKNLIKKKIDNFCNSRKLQNKFNEKLVEEVVNLVEKPQVILCKFDAIYLKIPEEILIITMQHHQKYFPLFDGKGKLTNSFLLVANMEDKKGYIKEGNQRVIEARLSDAKFFWEKNKNQSLVKQITKLKTLSFFNHLGTFYDRTQRLRKLSVLVSSQLNLIKEKVEIASSVCKADLVSDLVKEYPELQGVMGKYFALEQGFEKDVSLAISEHYLPIGLNSEVPKKPISVAVALIDKIDILVGFFGLNEKPTSSKDPFALRRSAIGLLRIITENNLNIQLKDLINYSIASYNEQNVNFPNKLIQKDILLFLKERFKNLLKDQKVRADIIEAVSTSYSGDNFLKLYKKSVIFNKNISKETCKDIIGTYKRASNIINQEAKDGKNKIMGQPETSLFNKEEEKNLFDKVNEIRKYFFKTKSKEDYSETLQILAGAKNVTENFFNNVIVNEVNINIKKNRLELLQMFCKTYNNFIDFSKIEGA